ncbi:MAG: hypothetical protein AB7O97_10850 [Planctomycetota bacterium]
MTMQLETLTECPACRDRFPTVARRRRCPTCGERLAAMMADVDAESHAPMATAAVAPAPRTAPPSPADVRSAPEFAPDLPQAAPPRGPALPLVVATGTALLSALLWAVVMGVTGYEIGYLAWAIGGLVGGAAMAAGGRGTAIATACAALTVGAILLGKAAFVSHELGKVEDQLRAQLTPAAHEEVATDAALFADLAADDDAALAAFLVERGYATGARPEDLTRQDLANFRRHTAPALRAFHANQWTLAQWQAQVVGDALREVSTSQIVRESMDGMDLLFALLGLSTAFGIVMRRSRADGLA